MFFFFFLNFQPPPNRRQNRFGDDHLLLWDFMQERDHQWFDDLASFIAEAESEESEYSELDLFDIDMNLIIR